MANTAFTIWAWESGTHLELCTNEAVYGSIHASKDVISCGGVGMRRIGHGKRRDRGTVQRSLRQASALVCGTHWSGWGPEKPQPPKPTLDPSPQPQTHEDGAGLQGVGRRVVCPLNQNLAVLIQGGGGGRDALEGKGPQRRPQRRPQKRFDRRLKQVAKAVRGGYCRLQMPLKLALGCTVVGKPWLA